LDDEAGLGEASVHEAGAVWNVAYAASDATDEVLGASFPGSPDTWPEVTGDHQEERSPCRHLTRPSSATAPSNWPAKARSTASPRAVKA
jgi:hypothetical protein